jgi:hypothetical protein
MLILALVAGMVFLVAVAFIVNKGTSTEPKSVTTVLIVSALTISAIQSMGVMASLVVTWAEPLNSIFKVVALISFDLKVLGTECMLGQSVARSYALRQLLSPCATVYIAVVIALKKKLWDPGLHYKVETVNAVGVGYQAFFVSILVSITLPFVCYGHPGSDTYSMVSNPSVLCFEGDEYTAMVIMGVLSLLVSVIPFLSFVVYATFNYKGATSDTDRAHWHLTMFRFLFFRYKPDAYYFTSINLLRSLLVCLVPVIARDSAALQNMTMAFIFISFVLV